MGKAVIIKLHNSGCSKRMIARELGISRNTVDKYQNKRSLALVRKPAKQFKDKINMQTFVRVTEKAHIFLKILSPG